jgi:maleylpyruvate isomerase
MTRPTAFIEGCRGSHATLERHIAGLTDEVARQPSLLPDWTVGHVLTHIARNADSVVRRIEGALRNEVVDQYAGGREGRANEIEAGAHRSAAELIADVHTTNAAVDALLASAPDDIWDRLSRPVGGGEQPVTKVVFSRWREVEVHLVDLGLGYTPARWPAGIVDEWLPSMLTGLDQRADRNALLAWTLGRSGPPELIPWG